MSISTTATQTKYTIGNVNGINIAYTLSQCINKNPQQHHLIITETTQTAQTIATELPYFLPPENILPINGFPDRETLPYDHFSPHQDITSERLRILHTLQNHTNGITIAPIQALLQPLPPPSFIHAHVFILKQHQTFNLTKTRTQLTQAGYYSTDNVLSRGEFSIRGSIIDIFPTGSNTPFRIDLFDDEIDSIRTFDPETQRSNHTVTQIEILPAYEFPLTDEAINHFQTQWHTHFQNQCDQSPILNTIAKKRAPGGIEYYLPCFFPETATLLDYLPNQSACYHIGNTHEHATQYWQTIQDRYHQVQFDLDYPPLPPQQLFQAINDTFEACQHYPQTTLKAAPCAKTSKTQHNANTSSLPNLKLTAHHKSPYQHLQAFLADTQTRVLFCTESLGRLAMMREHLARIHCTAQTVDTWADFINSDTPIGLLIAPLSHGQILHDLNITLITEADLFSTKHTPSNTRTAIKKQDDQHIIVKDITELPLGCPVVHIDHGIGYYQGLTTLKLGKQETEFLAIEYANADKLYVPISNIHLISRYSATDGTNIAPHKLGTDKWSKTKEKALKRLHDTAAQLLEIYAKRAAKPGFAFEPPCVEYDRFADSFPFELTPDQATAIDAVIDDLTRPHPMDRLLCGDVGFGKTEVALRAAFISAHQGRQVALLAPTTLLCEQHAETFSLRFADWPINVASLSRFKTSSEQKTILNQLANGEIDILIGTHKILSKTVQFKNLGLIIIDEEHRFGVRHKEKLRELRTDVDMLSMTATPIPRTLQMSLSQVRDLSLITTAPAKRLAIHTTITPYRQALVQEAIQREVMRGGQVYFLHNNVTTIERTTDNLRELMPQVRFEFAHGQMPERTLERMMADFYHNHFQVLVCTTIIETGIDIPNANTIIIDRADKLGLAQLHQLRGRVGRSHQQAYAYLLTPPKSALTTDAKKRLDAIQAANTLGAGFTIASFDLEIRGAGELLGAEQSGHMQAIGFTLYLELLERTIQSLKSGKSLSFDALATQSVTEVTLGESALIPESYIPDVHTRLLFYHRVSQAPDLTTLEDVQVNLIDRFGLLPEPTQVLFEQARIRLAIAHLSIAKIDLHAKGGKIIFADNPRINPANLIKLIQQHPKTYQLKGQTQLNITQDLPTIAARISCYEAIVNAGIFTP